MPPQQICKVHSSIRTPSAARCRYYVFADGGRGLCHFVADGLIWPVPSALYFGGVVWQQYVQRELLVDPPIGRTRGRCPPWLLPLRRRCCWRIETGISNGKRCRIPLNYVGTCTSYIRCICTIPELPPLTSVSDACCFLTHWPCLKIEGLLKIEVSLEVPIPYVAFLQKYVNILPIIDKCRKLFGKGRAALQHPEDHYTANL